MKLRRVELGISQEKLATCLGVTPQQLQKYEKGANRIGASRLFEIAQALDVPVGYFFRDIADMNQALDEMEAPDNAITEALGDAATVRLLSMFASVRDPVLKRRVIGLVEAVIQHN
ncbi:MAG: helix-turn-helix transcriptional regulator [Acuticoccus sp.]